MSILANKFGHDPVRAALSVPGGQVGADAHTVEEALGYLLPRLELASPQAELPTALWARAAHGQRQMRRAERSTCSRVPSL